MSDHVFSKTTKQWWDIDGPFKMLHRMNDCRLAFIHRAVQRLHGQRILDYGCGGGLLAESLSQCHAHVTGIDCNPQAIAAAKEHAREGQHQIDYIVGDIDDLPDACFRDTPFDILCALECLEHVEQPQ